MRKSNRFVIYIFDGMHGFVPDSLLETLIVIAHMQVEVFGNGFYGLFPKEIL